MESLCLDLLCGYLSAVQKLSVLDDAERFAGTFSDVWLDVARVYFDRQAGKISDSSAGHGRDFIFCHLADGYPEQSHRRSFRRHVWSCVLEVDQLL